MKIKLCLGMSCPIFELPEESERVFQMQLHSWDWFLHGLGAWTSLKTLLKHLSAL